MKRIITALLLLAFMALPSCTEGRAEVYSVSITAMDTSCTVTVYGEDNKAAADACKELLLGIEAELSVTLSGSKVYALNTGGKVETGTHLKAVAEKAIGIKSITDGAFEPCIYPLVKLWGFTTGDNRVPSSKAITEAVGLVNNSVLKVSGNTVSITDGMVDFGGITKGYAADMLAEELKGAGVEAAVISLGGNIKTLGSKPNGKPWNIGISSPDGGGKLLGTLAVGECAVVTSGSYIRNFTENGKLYHHIIDPRTGYPADNGLVSVTVVCDDAAMADGLTTAFFVMGMEKASSLAKALGVDTVFVTDDCIYVSAGLKEKFTPDDSTRDEYSVIYN